MLGRDILARYRVINHDARDASTLEPVGTTSTGVSVHLNREFLHADVRITTGFGRTALFRWLQRGPENGCAGTGWIGDGHDPARRETDRAP